MRLPHFLTMLFYVLLPGALFWAAALSPFMPAEARCFVLWAVGCYALLLLLRAIVLNALRQNDFTVVLILVLGAAAVWFSL